MVRTAYDISHFRGVVCDLTLKGIISEDEQDAILRYLSTAKNMTEETVAEAASLAANSEEAYRELKRTILRDDVLDTIQYVPAQPSSEPQAPLDLANEVMSEG